LPANSERSIDAVEASPVGPPDFAALERCATEAQRAVLGLWDLGLGTFWRSTEQRARVRAETTSPSALGLRKTAAKSKPAMKAAASFFPTVTLKCTESLVSYLIDCPDWATLQIRNQVNREVVPRVAAQRRETLKSTLDTAGTSLNIFTLSFYVRVHTAILRLRSSSPVTDHESVGTLSSAIPDLMNHPAFSLPPGAVGERRVHPFILYHAVRALSGAKQFATKAVASMADALLARIRLALRGAVERLLAKQLLGADTPSDAVALGFCAAALLVDYTREDLPHAIASMMACLNAQDGNGCWPLGRVVPQQKDIASDRLEIPTHEIAEALADAALALVNSAHGERLPAVVTATLGRLRRAMQYVERSLTRLADSKEEPRAGWCAEHSYETELVESWTSATVLSAVLSIRRLFEELRRREILGSFATVSPNDRDWPAWLRWEEFRSSGETDREHPVLPYLEKRLIAPIRANPRQLPPTDPRSVSVLLFGPPGTSKTTIVKAVADALKWPVVMLSPGNFIEKGLEYIESQARSVFDRLLELSKAVVIFDECDELFRDRVPLRESEQTRGITAFVTASMLPKLQELHDRGRIIFFICTNHFETIDAAMKRGGRIDHVIGVGPPDRVARLAVIKSAAGKPKRKHFDAALDELAHKTERFTRSELQHVVRLLLATPHWSSVAEAKAVARQVAQIVKRSLTISVAEYNTYKELERQFSHPLLEIHPDSRATGQGKRT